MTTTTPCTDCGGRGSHPISRRIAVDAYVAVRDADGQRETVPCEMCRGEGKLVQCEEQGCRAMVAPALVVTCCGLALCQDCFEELHFDHCGEPTVQQFPDDLDRCNVRIVGDE